MNSLISMSSSASTAQLNFVLFPCKALLVLYKISLTTAKWAQSASPSNIYDTAICLKLGLDEYSAHNGLIKFVPQMSVSTLPFPQLCQSLKITWKYFYAYFFKPCCHLLMFKYKWYCSLVIRCPGWRFHPFSSCRNLALVVEHFRTSGSCISRE